MFFSLKKQFGFLAYVQGAVFAKRVLLVTFPADAGATGWTERVGDAVWTEGITRHLVEAGVPGDLGLQGVDHHVAVDGTDAAVADSDRCGI